MSPNATPATRFARCHQLTQPWQCESQRTRNTRRLKCCACHAKWRWRSPKCCPCYEKCKSSSENLAKVLRLSHRTTFDKLRNMLRWLLTRYETCCDVTKCHACHTKQGCTTFQTSKSEHFCSTPLRHGLRRVADGCEPLRTAAQRLANTPSTPKPPEWKCEPLLCIRENGYMLQLYNPFLLILNLPQIINISGSL